MNNISSKILPLEHNAPIKYDLMLYMEMEALLSNLNICESAKAWYMTNYIQFYCLSSSRIHKNQKYFYKNVHISQPKNPFVQMKITSSIFHSSSMIIDYVIRQIEKGRYVKIQLDHFYLPEYKFYNDEHIYHTEFVYGYDLDNKLFNIIGSSNLSMGGFERKTVTFEDFIKAYKSTRKAKPLKTITAMEIRTDKVYHFSSKKCCEWLGLYIGSKQKMKNKIVAINDKHSKYNIYGINTYNELIKILKSEFDSNDECSLNSIKYLQAFADHKKIMLQRIEYLEKRQDITKEQFKSVYYDYSDIVDEFNIIINLYIKLFLSGKKNNAEKIIFKLEKLNQKEEDVLILLLSFLKNNRKNYRVAL